MFRRDCTAVNCIFALFMALVSSAAAQHATTSSASQQAPPVSGLVPDHATLSVENLDREAEWYSRVLGFKMLRKLDSNPDMINAQMAIPGYRIDLVKYKGSKRPAPVDPLYLQQGWIHVVFHVDDVSAAWKQLQALQVETIVNKDANGTPIQLMIRDPEGNALEIRRNLQ